MTAIDNEWLRRADEIQVRDRSSAKMLRSAAQRVESLKTLTDAYERRHEDVREELHFHLYNSRWLAANLHHTQLIILTLLSEFACAACDDTIKDDDWWWEPLRTELDRLFTQLSARTEPGADEITQVEAMSLINPLYKLLIDLARTEDETDEPDTGDARHMAATAPKLPQSLSDRKGGPATIAAAEAPAVSGGSHAHWPVSMREFARLAGVSVSTVSEAIAAGRFPAACVYPNGRINASAALKAWKPQYRGGRARKLASLDRQLAAGANSQAAPLTAPQDVRLARPANYETHPLAGLFGCRVTPSGDLLRQGVVLSATKEAALVQVLRTADLSPAEITAVPLRELLSGEWIFFRSEAELQGEVGWRLRRSSPAKAAAARLNGKKGGRPPGSHQITA